MSDDLVKQSIAELQDLVQCRCHPAYKDRGLHDPNCECDNAENVKVVADRIEELEAKLAEVENVARAALEYVKCNGSKRSAILVVGDKLRAALASLQGDKA